MDDKRPSKRSSRFDKDSSASSSSATLEANDDPVPPKRPASARVSARSDAKASGRTSARISARGPAAGGGGGGGNAMTRMAARRAARRKRQEEEAARLAAEAARPLSASELVQKMSQESAKKKQEREEAKIREEEEAIEKAEREAEEKDAAEEAKRKAEEQAAKKAEAEAKRSERAAQKAAAESGEAEAVEEIEEEEDAKPRFKLHWSLKIVAFLLLVFLGYLGFLWGTTGHVPALHTAEGRDELVRDVKEDWATLTAFSKVSARDLDKYLEGKPPETKEQIAALVDESKQDLAEVGQVSDQSQALREEHDKPAAPKADASHVDVYSLRKAPTDKKVSPYGGSPSNVTTASRHASSPASTKRGVKVADPRLATARDIYQKAIALYVQADPRSANSATVQKYLHQAKPLFEQVLDECDKAAGKGVSNGELDRLQHDAAMRLYDCNKRTTL